MLDFIYKVNPMKLKLETQNNSSLEVTVLVVTEKVELSHLAVLKAGLTKLIQSGKKNLLLDLAALQASDIAESSLPKLVLDLRTWAVGFGAQVLVISPIEALGHAKTREEGIKVLGSAEGPLLAMEAKLQAELKAAQEKKEMVSKKLTQTSNSGDPKLLQKTNSMLKRSISETEKLVEKFLKLRQSDPHSLPAFQLSREALEEVLTTALKKEGILQ
jgi:hypothetical protein